MFRSLAKRLPHPLLMRLHQRYQLRTQSALARMVAQRTGLPVLETLDLSQIKTSDTVFVLGSGWSINEITEQRWKVIGRHDTIALNFWLVHPFVPESTCSKTSIEPKATSWCSTLCNNSSAKGPTTTGRSLKLSVSCGHSVPGNWYSRYRKASVPTSMSATQRGLSRVRRVN